MADAMMMFLGEAHGVNWYWAQPGEFENPGVYYWDGARNVLCVPHLAAVPEAPAQAAPSADEVERGDVVAFEFYNRATGHAIVDYSVNTHVGNLSADKGYEARPLVYADKREEVTDGSKPIPLWQAREALDELEAAARGDEPFNHFAAGLVRSALEQAAAPEAPAQVGLLSDEDLADCGLLSEFGQVSMPQEECPKCGSVEWDDIYERGYPPAVGRRCARCDHEWNLAVEAKTYGDGTKAVGTAPLPLQSPAETQSAHGDVSGEVIAMRGDFDGYGYRYIDSGSGSDWRTRHPDWEPLMLAVLVEDERAAFEAWAHTQGYEVKSRKSDGRYWSSHTHQAWECWQARAALAQLDSLEGGE